MPRPAEIDQAKLIALLCTPMPESTRAEQLGVARSSYYAALDRLARDGILRARGALMAGMTFNGAHPRSKHSGTHHAPVLHVRWVDGAGRWEVQGSLLDEWDDETGNDTSVTVRWRCPNIYMKSFAVRPIGRWSTKDTELNISWKLTYSAIEKLTVAIARVIDAEAILIPEETHVVAIH